MDMGECPSSSPGRGRTNYEEFLAVAHAKMLEKQRHTALIQQAIDHANAAAAAAAAAALFAAATAAGIHNPAAVDGENYGPESAHTPLNGWAADGDGDGASTNGGPPLSPSFPPSTPSNFQRLLMCRLSSDLLLTERNALCSVGEGAVVGSGGLTGRGTAREGRGARLGGGGTTERSLHTAQTHGWGAERGDVALAAMTETVALFSSTSMGVLSGGGHSVTQLHAPTTIRVRPR